MQQAPTKCKWCGCGMRSYGTDTIFQCWTVNNEADVWAQSAECKLKVAESLIQRAIETLKTASRYTVAPVSRQELNWEKNPDGPVTDSKAVDEAISILEGERDE